MPSKRFNKLPKDMQYEIYNLVPLNQCKYCTTKYKSFHYYCSNKCYHKDVELKIMEYIAHLFYILVCSYFTISLIAFYLIISLIAVKILIFSI